MDGPICILVKSFYLYLSENGFLSPPFLKTALLTLHDFTFSQFLLASGDINPWTPGFLFCCREGFWQVIAFCIK